MNEDTTAYFYVNQPVKTITGIAHFGKRENLIDSLAKHSARPQRVKDRINDFPNFIVSRMYYYINDSELPEYLQTNLLPTENTRINNFPFITDIDIC